MVQGLVGGALIGAAAVLLMALEGRIAGISGIVGGLMPPEPAADRSWRLAFVVGLVIGPVLVGVMTGQPNIGRPAVGAGGALLAGLCVGMGTGLGNGCTSGHGICGLARLSSRSLAATLTFMATAGLTVLLIRHVL
ncbi:MAG: YeeE/YedE family protein [Geminicoccaceae bacterium]